MSENLEKPNKQTKAFEVEEAPVSPIVTGKFVAPVDDEPVDEMDIVLEPDDSEDEDEQEDDLAELDLADVEDEEAEPQAEPEEKPQPKRDSKEQRKIQALKNQALKLQAEKAELEKKLAEKKDAAHLEELQAKYINKGYDADEAREKANYDIRQSNIERQLESLIFEKQNRKVLDKYPDADLEKIMVAVKSSGMTAEQVCRGLYGVEMPEREKRAIAALTDSGEQPARSSVSSAMKSAEAPKRGKPLTAEEQEIKRHLERLNKRGKPLTDEEVRYYIRG